MAWLIDNFNSSNIYVLQPWVWRRWSSRCSGWWQRSPTDRRWWSIPPCRYHYYTVQLSLNYEVLWSIPPCRYHQRPDLSRIPVQRLQHHSQTSETFWSTHHPAFWHFLKTFCPSENWFTRRNNNGFLGKKTLHKFICCLLTYLLTCLPT